MLTGEALATVKPASPQWLRWPVIQLQSSSEHRPRGNFCFKASFLRYVDWPECAPDTSLVPEKVLRPLELELVTAVSCCADAEN